MTNEQRYDNLVHLDGTASPSRKQSGSTPERVKVVPISAHPKFPKRQASRPIGPSFQGSE